MLPWLLVIVASAAEPRFQAGVQGGWQVLAGSNGDAFSSGPLVRVDFTPFDNGLYATQASYTFASHGLGEPGALYEDPLAGLPMTGSAQLHSVMFGARVYPFVTDTRTGIYRGGIQPWVASDTGILLSVGTLEAAGITSKRTHAKWVLDAAAGVDFAVGDRLVLAVLGRAGALPTLRRSEDGVEVGVEGESEDDPVRLETLWMFHPALSAAFRF